MDPTFWYKRWASREIGFHRSDAHPLLVAHVDALGLAPGARVFLPLCGKTLDIGWLLGRGVRVVGAELSETAVRELFAELNVEPEVTDVGPLRHYRADGLDVWVGDLFDVTTDTLGTVDAVYDRAALVALPPTMRPRYARHLVSLTGAADQLLITFDYDQSLADGPPFSVPGAEVGRLYGETHALDRLADDAMPGGLRGVPAREQAWRLSAT